MGTRELLTAIVFGLASMTACSAGDEADDPADTGRVRTDARVDTGSLDARADTGANPLDSGGVDSAPPEDTGPRETCGNGLDDNGDGQVDERCPCTPGTSQRCYPGPMEQVGRGLCAQGTQGCEGTGEFGTWTECVGAVTPTEDRCGDALDQDCNGRADDGAACLCAPGTTRECYTGPAGTAGRGICRAGTQTCDSSGRDWGTCLDEVLPRAELCSNRIDDDCDGVVDNGPTCACTVGTSRACYPGPSEEVGRGRCRAGTQMCDVSGTRYGACTGAVGPTTEVCGNGIDDDCDGSPDDGCPPPATTCTVTVNLSGDCLTTRCPTSCPYPIACNIVMAGGDHRGCVASSSDNPVVYFQEGDACGAGRVTGTLTCSSVRGSGLNASNCVINKPTRYYPTSRSGCPDTSG